MVGRKKHTSNQAFGQWCKDMGFDMDNHDRADAMWLVQNWACCDGHMTELSHPSRIRRWFNESNAGLDSTLVLEKLETKQTVALDQRTAERLAKVANRATAGDEGSDIAKRQFEATAKKHNKG